jgi:hypothetical protein
MGIKEKKWEKRGTALGEKSKNPTHEGKKKIGTISGKKKKKKATKTNQTKH